MPVNRPGRWPILSRQSGRGRQTRQYGIPSWESHGPPQSAPGLPERTTASCGGGLLQEAQLSGICRVQTDTERFLVMQRTQFTQHSDGAIRDVRILVVRSEVASDAAGFCIDETLVHDS